MIQKNKPSASAPKSHPASLINIALNRIRRSRQIQLKIRLSRINPPGCHAFVAAWVAASAQEAAFRRNSNNLSNSHLAFAACCARNAIGRIRLSPAIRFCGRIAVARALNPLGRECRIARKWRNVPARSGYTGFPEPAICRSLGSARSHSGLALKSVERRFFQVASVRGVLSNWTGLM